MKRSPDSAKVPVDEHGLDSHGRMVAYFGSPVIDDQVDPIWSNLQAVTPTKISGHPDASATFKVLWDDRALYVLAEVKDKNVSAQAEAPYRQDALSIFIDENNDKTLDYGVDDAHFTINCENVLYVGSGDAERLYSTAYETEDGYVIQARIALKTKPENGKVLGFDLLMNDAVQSEQAGALSVFDLTGNAWKDTGLFGEILLTCKPEGAVSGRNPYDLMSLTKNARKLDFQRYRNARIVKEAIEFAERVLSNNQVPQNCIDEQYAVLKDAIRKLQLTDEAAAEKYFKPVPDEYRVESDRPGTIETLMYKAPNLNNGTDDKRMHVYLPYGYDASDSSKKYNVLYLMHGGGENEDLIFGGPGQSRQLKKIVDNMIAKGDIEPLIVVTPTFYGGKNDVALFHEKLMHHIVPFVETQYHTYAKSGSLDDLNASRAHRAFGGFSMGSVTTWYTFIHCLDYFKYYMPLCGDSWVYGRLGGGTKPVETAEYLANAARASGYAPQDYYIFSATGDLDIAYPNLKPQIDAMKQLTDVFIYSSDTNKGNFYFIAAGGGSHAWTWVTPYIYNILPDLFDH
ncbi:sugar-binding protein [Marinicrinis lubricantis]|uniref:Sugar-binding protein n=1 Tax=Marinicrinis lubricantis TaxID=2086470 RepID=A0ABW1ISU5_9BACL